MRKVILQASPAEVTVEEVSTMLCYKDPPVLFAYKSEGKSGWCFLTKISASNESPEYGFVAMNYTNTHPRFVANSLQGSLTLAVKGREVFAFNGVNELVSTIINK